MRRTYLGSLCTGLMRKSLRVSKWYLGLALVSVRNILNSGLCWVSESTSALALL